MVRSLWKGVALVKTASFKVYHNGKAAEIPWGDSL